jgi:hypothetical protein
MSIRNGRSAIGVVVLTLTATAFALTMAPGGAAA